MSKLPWDDERCIVCTRTLPLSLEHVIPDVIGGRLTCAFLCQRCNSEFGRKLDVQVKSDPSVRMAVHNLSSTLPEIARSYFEGQVFNVKADGPKTQAVYKRGKLKTKTAKLGDGSLVEHTPDARTFLRKTMKKAGYSTVRIEEQLEKFDSAPENKIIDFLPGIPSMAKWTVHGFEPEWQGELVCPEFLLKIAYEYTALCVGGAIFDTHFDLLRQALENGSPYSGYEFERGFAGLYESYHGIAITNRYPYTVQIMLFGKLRYKLAFSNIEFGGECLSYFHDLATGDEECNCI